MDKRILHSEPIGRFLRFESWDKNVALYVYRSRERKKWVLHRSFMRWFIYWWVLSLAHRLPWGHLYRIYYLYKFATFIYSLICCLFMLKFELIRHWFLKFLLSFYLLLYYKFSFGIKNCKKMSLFWGNF